MSSKRGQHKKPAGQDSVTGSVWCKEQGQEEVTAMAISAPCAPGHGQLTGSPAAPSVLGMSLRVRNSGVCVCVCKYFV